MIPRIEHGTLRLVIVAAKEFAEDGRPGTGYTCLTQGLHKAEAAAERGEPWAEELALRYREAIDAFIDRYGVRME